jgi:hypothetical protein
VREVKAEEVGDLFDRQAARLAVRDELAILVPFKNRERYLAHLLRGLPAYLERTGVRDYHIYVAEQDGDDMLNVALARNVAAAFCLARAAYPTLVFHNVDVIPVENVDYGFDHNQSWFLDAGSCKVRGRDFLSANGHNPAFVGWGGEDVEFYHRLDVLGLDCREWHREEGSRRAVVANLELPPLDDAGALDWSRHYFGHAGGARASSASRAGRRAASSSATTRASTSCSPLSARPTTPSGIGSSRCRARRSCATSPRTA